jgi:pyruvate,water dikinase
MQQPVILPLAVSKDETVDEARNLAVLGGKGRSLTSLVSAGFSVPGGYVVTTDAYRQFVGDNNLTDQLAELSRPAIVNNRVSFDDAAAKIAALFTQGSMPPGIEAAITRSYDALGKNLSVAVRSSATAEDLPDLSFAGQQDTYLNVAGTADVVSRVKDCWASLWTARAISYRHEMNIDSEDVAMAVVVQLMVPAESAGVAFTVNAVTGNRDEMMVSSSYGLGESVVGGTVTPDHITLSREGFEVIEQVTGAKEDMIVQTGNQGTEVQQVTAANRSKLSISEADLAELARIALCVESHFNGVPQDIEWAVADGKIWLLQSRPITTLPPAPIDARWEPPYPGARLMRRGFVEHLLGPLSPLFEDLYLYRALEKAYAKSEHGSRRSIITKPRHVTVNGVAYTGASPARPDSANALMRGLQLIWMITGGILSLKTWVWRWRRFGLPAYQRHIRHWQQIDIASASDETLFQGIEALADADAAYWIHTMHVQGAAKIANLVMTNFLKKHAAESDLIIGKITETGSNFQDQVTTDLLNGFPSRTSDAVAEVARIAATARDNDQLRDLIMVTPAKRLLETLRQDKSGRAIAHAIDNYLEQYGQQTHTLDFADPIQRESPLAVLMNFKNMVAGIGNLDPAATQLAAQKRREEAVIRAEALFTGKIKKEFQKRYRIDCADTRFREDAMFYMGAAWEVLRPMALELGRRLTETGSLNQADDIFYLTSDEILTALIKSPGAGVNIRKIMPLWLFRKIFGVDAPAFKEEIKKPELIAIAGLKELATKRRERHLSRKRLHAPGVIPKSEMSSMGATLTQRIDQDEDSNILNGFTVTGGTITAVASVILSADGFHKMEPGSILVCPYTTPGWTQLFPQATGLVTDIGGVLGHGSIVAREYGIPAVMGTGAATRRIKHGQMITVDGDAGTVEIVW